MNLIKKVGEFLGSSTGSVIEKIANVANTFIQTPEEREKFRQAAEQEINRHNEDVMQQLSEQMKSEDAAVTDRWKADMQSDSWLSKNTRPIVMLSLLAFLYLLVISDSFPKFNFEVKDSYVELLQMLLMTTVVAYFSSRGIEKVQSIKKK